MNKNRWIWGILVIPVVAIACWAWAQEGMLQIDNSEFPNPRRVPAWFEHDLHNETAGLDDCSTCHHLYEDGKLLEDESSEDQACAECHSVRPEKKGDMPLMKAYHTMCKGCHVKEKKGPVMCGECHPRRAVASAK